MRSFIAWSAHVYAVYIVHIHPSIQPKIVNRIAELVLLLSSSSSRLFAFPYFRMRNICLSGWYLFFLFIFIMSSFIHSFHSQNPLWRLEFGLFKSKAAFHFILLFFDLSNYYVWRFHSICILSYTCSYAVRYCEEKKNWQTLKKNSLYMWNMVFVMNIMCKPYQ